MLLGDLVGEIARDRAGHRLGRIVDVRVEPGGPDDRLRITAVVVATRWYARLLGFERPEVHDPWLFALLRRLLRHGTREVPWERVRVPW